MSLYPEELEYAAGQQEIEVMPRFDCGTIWLIAGDIGPIKAGIPVNLPLWVALQLRAQNKCKIIPPVWMNKATLEQVKKKEVETGMFTEMPSEYYMIFANLLFEACPQDIPDADEVKLLIKDIWDCRLSKLRTAVLTSLDQKASWARVDNLTQIEMCNIRPFFTQGLEQIYRFHKTIQVARHSAAGNSTGEVRD